MEFRKIDRRLIITCVLSIFLLFTVNPSLLSQPLATPTDYLSKEFHKERREALRKLMPDHSVVVVFSYPERIFSRDINYVYHENPDLFYFSGYQEPNAVLLIFKENQQDALGAYNELFFVQKRDPYNETWTGKRLGVEGTRTLLGFDRVFTSDQFDSLCPDLSKLTVINAAIGEDIPFDRDPGNLFNIVHLFRKKASIPPDAYNGPADDLELIAKYASYKDLENYIEYFQLANRSKNEEDYRNNEIVQQLLHHPDSATFETLKKKIISPVNQLPVVLYAEMTSTLREIKTPEEIALLRKAVYISSIAHAEVMRAIQPNMSERELEGIFFLVHMKYGAEEEGYGPIVGAGGNGCTLHYEENNVTNLDSQMVLMDVAAEYHGYSADVTRTVPSTGKYTEEQKAIYQLVYEAQEEIFKLCRQGTPFDSLDARARQVLGKGLVKLRIIKNASEVGTYYPHPCSHHMGLDVHDKSNYGPLRENMVITVEPGVYIRAGSACDKKWWNIGVRIEDDVLIGKDRCELLSADAPRKWQDVENMVAQKSALNDLRLPAMK